MEIDEHICVVFLDQLLRLLDGPAQSWFYGQLEALKNEARTVPTNTRGVRDSLLMLAARMMYCACLENLQEYIEDFEHEVNCAFGWFIDDADRDDYMRRLQEVRRPTVFSRQLHSAAWQKHKQLTALAEAKREELEMLDAQMDALDETIQKIEMETAVMSTENQKQIDRAERNGQNTL
jgi:hypothetical protein